MKWYVDSKSMISDRLKFDSQDSTPCIGKSQPIDEPEAFNDRDFDHDDIYGDMDPPEPDAEPIQPVADDFNGMFSGL